MDRYREPDDTLVQVPGAEARAQPGADGEREDELQANPQAIRQAEQEEASPAPASAGMHAAITMPGLEAALQSARDALLAAQRAEGHWIFELEADATIPAEYVLLTRYLGEPPEPALEAKIGAYLRRIQGEQGGWPLFHGGATDVSASIKAYFALKMIGEPLDAPHMLRARAAILAAGGIERANVFTRVQLALFDIISWRAVPMMPVEIMLLPQWFPFHLSKISYWARTVIVPLLVLQARGGRACARNRVRLDELFTAPAANLGLPARAPHQKLGWYRFFRAVDAVLRVAVPLIPATVRARATARAVQFVDTRLNGEDGLGAIYPAIANSIMMYDALGVPPQDPRRQQAREALRHLLVIKDDEAYCQPCVSPVWDTSLAAHALLECGDETASAAARRGLDWLVPRQVLDTVGDWEVRRPNLRPGGWAFQYANAYYPDVDDTAVVALALDRLERAEPLIEFHGWREAVTRAAEWVIGMQSSDGGWGAFEPENTHTYLDNIPFSDHGAMLDPPTVDVSARCVAMLGQLGAKLSDAPLARGVDFILQRQESNGSWFGRWGTNYIYGTWSALCGLNAAGLDRQHAAIRRAAQWLISIQNDDGGWGEDGDSYRLDYHGHVRAPSNASQSAWAILGLLAAGEIEHPALARGVDFLIRTQGSDGFWHEPWFTAVGFPRVFYLRYHGYPKFFPLWALARYRRMKQGSQTRVEVGI